MSIPTLAALIVDDDSISRLMVSHVLEQEGFSCTSAMDANEALTFMGKISFDLVVTDLCMPVRHGHSLALEILGMDNRPLVVVHTAIDDPRMTRELMSQGVDDIVYKPAKYPGFAAKMFVWALRHKNAKLTSINPSPPAHGQQPILSTPSLAAVDTFFAATTDTSDAADLSKTIEADRELIDQMLALANSPFYNRSGVSVTDTATAIKRLGFKKVAEMALDRLRQTRPRA